MFDKVKTKIDAVFVSKKKLTIFSMYLLRSSQMNIVVYDVMHQKYGLAQKPGSCDHYFKQGLWERAKDR